MIINVEATDKIHSNKFLRALWAEFRAKFGKCSWCYVPSKRNDKKYIDFGFMDIGETTINVGISYQRKGVIKAIHFEGVDEKSSWGIQIQGVVNKVIHNIEPIPQYIYNVKVGSLFPLSEYHSSNISIEPISCIESLLQLTISGYDKIDARYQLLKNLDNILAVISVETNCPFWISKSPNKDAKGFSNCSSNSFTQDLKWLDGYPVEDNFLTISKNGMEMINQIACTYLEKSIELGKFINSCHQFHLARKQDAMVWDKEKLQMINAACSLHIGIDSSTGIEDGQQEIATSLYMSSLEIAADIEQVDNKRCEKCGQMVYSILSKVKKLTEKYSDSNFVKSFISPYYNKRSKFLHQGDTLIKWYSGTSIPMLNVEGEAFVIDNIALINVREYTGHFLRQVLQESLVI